MKNWFQQEKKDIFFSGHSTLFSSAHKLISGKYSVIEAERFIMYGLLTLFIYPWNFVSEFIVQSESWLRQSARCHARVSHTIPAGFLAEILARITRSSRENWIREETRDLGQNSLYSAPFLALLSWSPRYLSVLISHSFHSEPSAMAFPGPPTEAPLQCITMHHQLPKNSNDARLNVSSDHFTEKDSRARYSGLAH